MKIIYIHQYFKTPEEGGAIRSYYLARALVATGHEVEMITTHNAKTYQQKNVEGIQVHQLPIFYTNHLGKWQRIRAFLNFIWKAFWKARQIPDVDLIYVSSTPLTVGVIALLLKWFSGKRYYFEARDLWPEVPIALGIIKGQWIQKTLRYLEKKIYQNADKLIALSPGILRGMQKLVPQKKIFLIPNMADCHFFQPLPYQAQKTFHLADQKFDWGKGYLISYFGTFGKANSLTYLVEIAAWFQQNQISGVQFCMIGEGAEKDILQEKIKPLKNIRILDAVNKFDLKKILAVTDIVYVSFLNHPILETTSPNKFFDGLAAGKLCVVNFKGWLKELVEREQYGFYANPEKPEEFYEKLKPFLQNQELLRKFQKNARKTAESQFSRQIREQEFLKLF